MPSVSLDTATLLIRVAFLIGAVTDGLAVIPILSPRVAVALFGGTVSEGNARSRFLMRIAASLLAGWTVLLVWGAIDPLVRRDLLIITVVPVVAGIVLATVFAVRGQLLMTRRVIPLWIHLGVVSVFYVFCYLISSPSGY